MMSSYTYVPPSPLAEFVDYFWLYENYQPSQPHERLLPNGTIELVMQLGDDTAPLAVSSDHDHRELFAGGVVVGAYSHSFMIHTTQPQTIIGVHFKPGGAFPFFPVPAHELHNLHVAFDALWGRDAVTLREQLQHVTAPAARFQILEHFLRAHATRPLTLHSTLRSALQLLQQGAHRPTIADVTEQLDFSSRRFTHLFRAAVGLTPKLFFRVARFQAVLHHLEAGQPVVWADLAFACGYYDQAHFNHDFQAFSGLTPTTYLTHRTEHRNHVPLPE